MGKSQKPQTIGFRYYMSLFMGLFRGPLDEIIDIKVGDRSVWRGSLREEGWAILNSPEIFGGDKGEGGIQGNMYYLPGKADQIAHPELNAAVGETAPGMRGVATLWFDGLVCSMNYYPKSWELRARRTTRGWFKDNPWYAEKATIWLHNTLPGKQPSNWMYEGATDQNFIAAMNPAHIMYELITNKEWARGVPIDLIDEPSFRVAADTLYDEGLGLCMRWNRQDSIKTVMQQVLDHIDAALYPDPASGRIKLKLIRNDYDPDTLPTFGYKTGLLEVTEYTTTTPEVAINEVILAWHDPVLNEPRQMRAQNQAGLQTSNMINSASVSYPGLPTGELASRIALRDLRRQSAGVKRWTLKVDRRAWKMPPAGVFKVSDEFRGVGSMILRAVKLNTGSITNSTMTITAIEDVFGIPETGFVVVQPPTWEEPDARPRPAEFIPFEVPYADTQRFLGYGDRAALPEEACFVATAAAKPTPTHTYYDLAVKAEGEDDYRVAASGSFCPKGDVSGSEVEGA